MLVRGLQDIQSIQTQHRISQYGKQCLCIKKCYENYGRLGEVMNILQSAKSGKLRKGKKELIKYLNGDRLTRNEAIKAKCYDCNGMGESGVCDTNSCALWPYSPFGKRISTVGTFKAEE